MLESFNSGEVKQQAQPAKKEPSPVQYEKWVTLILPLAVPGVGKTTLHEEVLRKYFKVNKDVKYTMISNDNIRESIAEEYRKLHPNKSTDHIYADTRHLFKDGYEKKIEEVVARKHSEQLIFLDKNHPPSILT